MHVCLHICNRVTIGSCHIWAEFWNAQEPSHNKLRATFGGLSRRETSERERQEKDFTAIYIYVKVAMRKMEMKYVAKADTIDAEK